VRSCVSPMLATSALMMPLLCRKGSEARPPNVDVWNRRMQRMCRLLRPPADAQAGCLCLKGMLPRSLTLRIQTRHGPFRTVLVLFERLYRSPRATKARPGTIVRPRFRENGCSRNESASLRSRGAPVASFTVVADIDAFQEDEVRHASRSSN